MASAAPRKSSGSIRRETRATAGQRLAKATRPEQGAGLKTSSIAPVAWQSSDLQRTALEPPARITRLPASEKKTGRQASPRIIGPRSSSSSPGGEKISLIRACCPIGCLCLLFICPFVGLAKLARVVISRSEDCYGGLTRECVPASGLPAKPRGPNRLFTPCKQYARQT